LREPGTSPASAAQQDTFPGQTRRAKRRYINGSKSLEHVRDGRSLLLRSHSILSLDSAMGPRRLSPRLLFESTREFFEITPGPSSDVAASGTATPATGATDPIAGLQRARQNGYRTLEEDGVGQV
jgi:hypothetical protein